MNAIKGYAKFLKIKAKLEKEKAKKLVLVIEPKKEVDMQNVCHALKCSVCKNTVEEGSSVRYNGKLVHREKCLAVAKLLNEKKVKCQECGEKNPKWFEVISGLEIGFCNEQHAKEFKEKDTLAKIMSVIA